MSFRGLQAINLDAKGRMAMPAKFRNLIELPPCEGRLVITIQPPKWQALGIYPISEFDEMERRIQSLPSLDETALDLNTMIIGHASDVELDGSGRILIPRELREYAGLEKKVVLVGQGKRLELWDEERWNKKREGVLQKSTKAADLPEALKSLSLF